MPSQVSFRLTPARMSLADCSWNEDKSGLLYVRAVNIFYFWGFGGPDSKVVAISTGVNWEQSPCSSSSVTVQLKQALIRWSKRCLSPEQSAQHSEVFSGAGTETHAQCANRSLQKAAAVTSCFLSLLLFIQKNLNRGESFTSPKRQTWCQVAMKWEICGLIPLERSGVEPDTCDTNELSCWKGFSSQSRQ